MDEAGSKKRNGAPGSAYSSPPCYACEIDPDHMFARRLSAPELRDLLASLLNAERALTAALDDPATDIPPEALAATRTATATAEAELARQIERLGTAAPPAAGDPNPAQPEAKSGGRAAIASRQRTILEEIERAMPLIEDREAAAALARVRTAHARALAVCEASVYPV